MAKKSKIAAQARRAALVERYADRRAALKRTIADDTRPEQQRAEARRRLQGLPRDSSPTRLRNRDSVDGRPRGFLRQFGLSRIRMRAEAHAGHLPGVTTSSW